MNRPRSPGTERVPLDLFARRGFAGGTAAAVVLSFVLFGMLFAVPQYTQIVLGADAQGSGVRLLAVMAGMLVVTPIGPRLTGRLGHRAVTATGFAVLAVALWVASRTTITSGDPRLIAWMVLAGLGLGLALPAALDAALADLDRDASGTGSAVLQSLRQVAGTFGAAVLGSVLNARYRASLPADLPAQVATVVRQGAEQGLAVAARLGSPELAAQVRAAYLDGQVRLMVVSLAVTATAVLGAVVAMVVARRSRSGPVDADLRSGGKMVG